MLYLNDLQVYVNGFSMDEMDSKMSGQYDDNSEMG